MTTTNLLGAFNGDKGLDNFARQFFAALAVSSFKERESSNYFGGRYFTGTDGSLIYNVSLSDEQGNEDLPYWVNVETESMDEERLISIIDGVVRSKLLPGGFRVARLDNFGSHDEQRVDY